MVAGDCQSFGGIQVAFIFKGQGVTLCNGTVGVWEI
jgi:hypothetical protein